jgi:Fic family protein
MIVDAKSELFKQVEQLNGIRQFDFLKMSVQVALKDSNFRIDRELICQLNNHAVALLCESSGRYRDGPIHITNSLHQPPPPDKVPAFMDHFIKYLQANWNVKSPIHLAAFALWRLNWIHPFAEGNGRTARATSYLVLCVKYGMWLPGRKTIPEQIRDDRSPYYKALRDADANSDDRIGRIYLDMMESYLVELITKQLQS